MIKFIILTKKLNHSIETKARGSVEKQKREIDNYVA